MLLLGLRWFGLPLVALATAISAAETAPTGVHPLLTSGMLAALVAMAVLTQVPAVGGRIDSVLAGARRRVALACDHADPAAHTDARIACWLTPEPLRAPLFRYEEQRQAVVDLVESARTGERGQCWFIEGESGSGKSRTGLLLVQTLVRNPDLHHLAGRAFLYDFAAGPSVQDAFLRRLGTARHEDAVLLVDNFHLVEAKVLRELTSRLLDRPGRMRERLVVLLCRPGDSWHGSPGSEVRLISEARRAGRYRRLHGPPMDPLTNSLREVDQGAAALVQQLEPAAVASASQMHLAQVIARNGGASAEVRTILDLLNGEFHAPEAPDYAAVLAALAALSMHRGLFSVMEVRRAVRLLPSHGALPARLATRTRHLRLFRRIRRTGFAPKALQSPRSYLLHEGVAELLIDRLGACPAFQVPFTRVATLRQHELKAAADPLGAWLVAVEAGAEEEVRAWFEPALNTGAYGPMCRALERASKRYDFSPHIQLQLALLLDRVGRFAEARQVFRDDAVAVLDTEPRSAAMLAAGRVEANHGEISSGSLTFLLDHSDPFVASVGTYWKAHLDAHLGRFASEGLLRLAVGARSLLGDASTHWEVYSLARMHFDSLRHAYLSGRVTPLTLLDADRLRIADYLRGRLPTFEALHLLYMKAHFVAHVLLPGVAIFGESVDVAAAALGEVQPSGDVSVPTLTRTAGALYRRSRDEFWQYGDREASYLQADCLNMDMVAPGADLQGLWAELHSYAEFIRQAGFADIASYPHLYFARWHVLMYYEQLLTGQPGQADPHLRAAKSELATVRGLDEAVGNAYGMLRADVLAALVSAIKGRLPRKVLEAAGQAARATGYDFEVKLTDHVLSRSALTSTELRTILRFYPIVHQ